MRACSCVVSEPRISDCSSDSPSAGDTPSAVGIMPRFQQHFALAAEIARRRAGRALDLGDLAADGLALRHEFEQVTIEVVETGTQFVE